MTISPLRRLQGVIAVSAALAALATGCGNGSDEAAGTTGDTKTVRVGVGGESLLVYLPTMLAQRLHYYRGEGVPVKFQELQSGSKALEAFQGGSVDVVSGYYDHTIQMQAKHRDTESFVNMLRYPSVVLVVSPKAGRKINSIADLKGAKVGVTAPGSSSDFFLKRLLVGNGLKEDAAHTVAVGGGPSAVAAMERGLVDAAVMIDPSVEQLQKRVGADKAKILVDTRTEQGVRQAYGVSTYPAAVLYSSHSWINGHEKQVRGLSAAIVHALKYINTHSAEEIAATMPAEYAGGDPKSYVKSIEAAKAAYSTDGRIQADGANAVYEVLSRSIPEVGRAHIDLKKTYTNAYLP
ncbi:NitT/TauT family transport system substrate-binding protein [Streptomyces tendae]|uniref:ABC transporter substrate-binding protein n=1 Tax=Streptomyces tendae TaxID=1932 RepID=UPI0038349D18